MSKRKVIPNCFNCYYGGAYDPQKQLASCDSAVITEPTVTMYDAFLKKDRKYVKRADWFEKSDCEYFVPVLSESNEDFELESITTFQTSFDCPFCGESIDVYDIGIEETRLEECPTCGKIIAVKGKEI